MPKAHAHMRGLLHFYMFTTYKAKQNKPGKASHADTACTLLYVPDRWLCTHCRLPLAPEVQPLYTTYMEDLQYDYTFMMADTVGEHGASSDELSQLLPELEKAHQDFLQPSIAVWNM